MDIRCRVKARGGKLDAGELGGFGKCRECHRFARGFHLAFFEADVFRQHIPQFRGVFGHAVTDGDSGTAGGHAVEISTCGGGGGGCIGHLVCCGGGDAHIIQRDAEFGSDDLRDFGVKPLPHFRAAMVHLYRTIGIDMHQGTRLIEACECEGDAEFDGCEGDALFQNWALLIEGFDGLHALAVIAGAFQFCGEFRQDVIDDLLAIGRYIAALGVIIALSHVERIKARFNRNRFHHALGKHHALRTAEATEGGAGNRVGVQAAGEDGKFGVIVTIVRMEHGAVVHTLRQVRRDTAAREQMRVHGMDATGGVEARLPIDTEIMPLAGHHHVVITIEPELCRAACLVGGECGEGCPLGRLAFLAAKCATHAAAFAGYGGIGNAQHMRHYVLHFGWVLGGGMHKHLAMLTRDGECDLAFEIEMLLAADAETVGDLVG